MSNKGGNLKLTFYLSKALIWTLSFTISFMSWGLAIDFIPKAHAIDEPRFDFSKEKYEKQAAPGEKDKEVIVHTVPYTLNGKTETYTQQYEFAVTGEAERYVPGIGANQTFNAYIYRLSGQKTYDLVIARNDQTANVGARSLIVEGLYYADNDTAQTYCKDGNIPEKPNLAFFVDEKPAVTNVLDPKPTVNYCYVQANGGTDSLYAWYIKKNAEHLVAVHSNQDWTATASFTNLPTVSFQKVTVPKECQDIFLKEALGSEIDPLFKSMDPDGILFKDGKSPLSKSEDESLYYLLYRSAGNPDYSDVHFLHQSGWIKFLKVYQSAAQGISSYWTDLSKAKKGADLDAVKLEVLPIAAARVTKGLGTRLGNIALKYPTKFFAESAFASSNAVLGASETIASFFWPTTIVAATIVVTGKGIAAWKESADAQYRKDLAQLMHASVYIPAHIAFHTCMVENKVAGWTQEDLDKEKTEWVNANRLFQDIFKDFIEAEKEASGANDGKCGVTVQCKFGIDIFCDALAGALCALIQLISSSTGWIMEHLFGSVFDAYIFSKHIVFNYKWLFG